MKLSRLKLTRIFLMENFIIKEINAIKTRWQLEQIYFNTVCKKIQNWADITSGSDNDEDELKIL